MLNTHVQMKVIYKHSVFALIHGLFSQIWNHPDVLHKVLAQKRMSAADDNDLDIDTESKANGEAGKSKKKKRVNNLPSDESYGEKNVISYDWVCNHNFVVSDLSMHLL